ncbi:MAG: hypothetical protein OXI58_13485 [Gemmatimonadota bacterium]|nr:hypothetical protein [Gemmatimonadota bacterium]
MADRDLVDYSGWVYRLGSVVRTERTRQPKKRKEKTKMKHAVASIILAVSLLQGSAHAVMSDSFLEVVWVEAEMGPDGFGGEGMNFTGEVRNTHEAFEISPYFVYVIIKKDGTLIDRWLGVLDRDALVVSEIKDWYNVLKPGASASFHIPTTSQPDDFDEYYIRPTGQFIEPNVLSIRRFEGSLGEILSRIEGWSRRPDAGIYLWGDFDYPIIDEQSIYFVDIERRDGSKRVGGYFEVVNRTNAHFGISQVALRLFDAEGMHIGWAVGGSISIAGTAISTGVRAYGRVAFFNYVVWRGIELDSDYTAADIVSWEMDDGRLKAFPYHIDVVEEEPTAVQSISWGAIKAAQRQP